MSYLGGLNSKVLNLWFQRSIEGGFCFEAIDTSKGGKRIGAFLCSIYYSGTPNSIDQELDTLEFDEEFSILMDLLHQPLHAIQDKIFIDNKCSSYVDGLFLSVLEEYGGLGVGGLLFEALETKAKELNLGAVLITATSNYTGRIVAKRGYEVVAITRYADYRWRGQQVLVPRAPHLEAQFCVKYL